MFCKRVNVSEYFIYNYLQPVTFYLLRCGRLWYLELINNNRVLDSLLCINFSLYNLINWVSIPDLVLLWLRNFALNFTRAVLLRSKSSPTRALLPRPSATCLTVLGRI